MSISVMGLKGVFLTKRILKTDLVVMAFSRTTAADPCEIRG